MVEKIASISYVPVASEIEAFLLEAEYIKEYRPFYNIKMADDKSFPYLAISKGENPHITITRKRNLEQADYFGPYPNVTDLKLVLKLLRKIFPFQTVKNHPKKECLYYHLKQCPCIAVHPELTDEYTKNLRNIKLFLKGKKEAIIKDLEKERDTYVKQEAFEKAQEIQRKIEKILLVSSEHYSPFRYQERPDLYYERLQKEVESLKSILQSHHLDIKKLERIECYDISNIQGKEATGSMVVLINGETANKEYRRFKIKSKNTPDDFHMMKEVITRRIKNTQWPYPDLFVIDGGKGQVGSVLPILRRNGILIPVIGLAKREEIIVIPQEMQEHEFVYEEVKLPKDTPGINLLRKIRDEAHRFALTYHRNLRKKRLLSLLG